MSDELRGRAARSLLTTLPFVMQYVGAGMREAGEEATPHQHRLLTMIAVRPRTPSEIARIQGVTPATATALVSTLESKGWVKRESDPDDRRKVVVTLTEAGRGHLASAQATAERSLESALESLSDEQLERLVTGLDVLGTLRTAHGHDCAQCAPTERKGAR